MADKIPDELRKAILDKQGDLLYTTMSEECSELIKACSKIVRKKFYKKELYGEDFSNLLEEIGDVELNIECIKEQIARDLSKNDPSMTIDSINGEIKIWQEEKNKKLSKIFLEK